MTLETWIKKYLRDRYSGAFDDTEAPKNIGLICRDMMEYVKGQPPPNVKTPRQVVNWIVNKIFKCLDRCMTCVACFDKDPPPVKRIVCHTSRYERRCKMCKKRSVSVPRGLVAGDEHFDPECDKGCKKNQILWREQGPHLNAEDLDAPFAFDDWMQFAADSRNLREELYPLIANEIMRRSVPVGKTLIVHGIPFNTKSIKTCDSVFETAYVSNERRWILDYWLPGQVPTEFDKVYLFESHPNGFKRQEEYPPMYNTIQEADNAIFYYSRFFKQFNNHMVIINDGDALSIGAFKAMEDAVDPNFTQWLCLPAKGKKKQPVIDPTAKPKDLYVNLSKFVSLVEKTQEFVDAGVQSPVATLVFLIILGETDFFQGEFGFGIGCKTKWSDNEEKRSKQTYGIWDTFYANLPLYSHMVQYYINKRDHETRRTIVIDEDLFKLFTQACYKNKYACKLKKSDVSYEDIKVYCSKLKDKRNHAPDDSTITRWGRQIVWNLNYWCNSYRNIAVDPFEMYCGKPLYGYLINGSITNDVSAKQKDIDEVAKRHFWKRKQKQEQTVVVISEKRKTAALDAIRGK